MEVLARREGRCVTEWADDTINNTIKNSKNNTNKSIQLIGRKFFPMAVPLSAIAFWAGRGMEAGFIREFVEVLGAGLQMVNDIFNIGEDNGAGRRTPVLEELCRTSPVTPDEPIGYVRALLNSSPAMDWAMAGARAHFEKSVRIAMDNDAPSMAAVARRRLESVDAVPSRVLALCLGGRIR